MSKKIWDKGSTAHSLVEQFTSGDDITYDQQLVAHDVYGSLAHVAMLKKVGIISASDYTKISTELQAILKKYEQGAYALTAEDEDVHSRIEFDISQKHPEAGAKMHSGRSRNDQVLVDMRLYSKDELIQVVKQLQSTIHTFISFAKKHAAVPMPGYTHMQRAMLSSVGLWAGQFAESLLDDMSSLDASYNLNDQSPLGSGAAYGVSLPLDRAYTAELLGFSKVQNNALYCQNSRGKIEGNIVHSLVQVMLTLSRFAGDMMLFTTQEFNYFSVPSELTTGSSIMPQKKNMDIMELLRSRVQVIIQNEALILSMQHGLISGYNRDLQELKKPFMQSFAIVKQSLGIVQLLVEGMEVNEEIMKKNLSPDMNAAYHAYKLSDEKGIPFRDAYIEVGKNLKDIPDYDPAVVLKDTKVQGGAGNIALEVAEKQLAEGEKIWRQYEKNFQTALNQLLKLT